MEVKIKNQNELIDADWIIEDGVMVVSPKEVFEPKDGDIVSVFDGKHVFINKDYQGCGVGDAYLGWNFDNEMVFKKGRWNYSRYATEEEKQKLFDKLAEEGWEWDAEKKQLVKLKWKPKLVGEDYYNPSFNEFKFEPYLYGWDEDEIDFKLYEMGWVFKTEQECQEFCNRLNKAIENIKP